MWPAAHGEGDLNCPFSRDNSVAASNKNIIPVIQDPGKSWKGFSVPELDLQHRKWFLLWQEMGLRHSNHKNKRFSPEAIYL